MTAGCTFTRHKRFAGVKYDPVYCLDMNIISSRLRSFYKSVDILPQNEGFTLQKQLLEICRT